MMTLVFGGAASGKSEYAEALAETLYSSLPSADLWYVATMAAYDEESRARIQKHRDRRAGKGYRTAECRNAEELATFAEGEDLSGSVLLFDDVGNYVANELFPPDMEWTGEPELLTEAELRDAALRLAEPFRILQGRGAVAFVVTNDIFGDVSPLQTILAGTENYFRVLAELNILLASIADTVTEVISGLPNTIKGGKT